jgi:hypothetical protein
MPRPRLQLPEPLIGDDGQEYPFVNMAFHSMRNEDEIDSFTTTTVNLIQTLNFQADFIFELTFYRLETEQYFEVPDDEELPEISETHIVRKLCIQNGNIVKRLFQFPKTYILGTQGSSQVTSRMLAFGDVLVKAQDATRDVYYPTYSDSNYFELPYTEGSVITHIAALLAEQGGPDFAGLFVGEVE